MPLFRRFIYLLRRSRAEAELAEELEHHRQLVESEYPQSGESAEEAVFAARRQMGNVTMAREASRQVWIAEWMESFAQDLRYAGRNLMRQPGFTLPALLALALGIGLNTSVFTVFTAAALRPWPVHEPAKVVNILKTWPGRQTGYGGFGVVEYRYLREHSRSVEGMIMMRSEKVRLNTELEGQLFHCIFATGNYFDVLGVPLALGRAFRTEEDRPGDPRAVAVLSYALWQRLYAGDPNVLGREIRIDDTPFTIIGVVSRGFTGTSAERHDMWVPLSSLTLARPNDPESKTVLFDPQYCCSQMAGRLAPKISRREAQIELTALDNHFRAQFGDKPQKVVLTGTSFIDQPNHKGKTIPILGLMMAAVGLVLLLACANVSNLLLARASARQSEIAARLALGATGRRLVRQLMTESLLLAILAAGIVVGLAYTLPSLVLRLLDEEPPNFPLQPDSRMLLYCLGLAILSAILFGLAPALRCSKMTVAEALRRQSAFSSPRFRLRELLLATQVAISTVLLLSAGLLLRGIQQARSRDLGFHVENVNLINIDLPLNGYSGASLNSSAKAAATSFTARLMERLRPIASHGRVAVSAMPPLGNSRTVTGMRLPGEASEQARPVLIQRATRVDPVVALRYE